MNRISRSLLLCLGLTTSFIATAGSQQVTDSSGRTLQVDVQRGTNDGDGSAHHPFLTISACVIAARRHDTCLVHAGTYPEMVTINKDDITIVSATGESAVVTAADKVQNWTTQDGKIYSAHVEARRPIPSAHAGQSWPGDALFVDGTEIAQAQFPVNSGDPLAPNWAHIESTPVSDKEGGRGAIVDTALRHFTTEGYETTVHIWSGTDPYDQYEGRVTNSTQGRVDYSPVGANGSNFAMPGGLYRVIGAPEFLSSDTWVYQESTNQLHWMPTKGTNPNVVDIRFKQRPATFDLSGASGVKLKGLTLLGGGIVMNGDSTHNIIDSVNVKYSSSAQRPHATAPSSKSDIYSFGVLLAGSDNLLANSVIEHTTQNGVTIHGRGNRVQNTLIHDVDTFGDSAAGIYIGDSDAPVIDAVVANNTIYRSGGAAIVIATKSRYSADPQPNPVTNLEIANNDIRETTMNKLDGGAIYACCRNVTTGTRVHDNWIQPGISNRETSPSGPAHLLPYAGVYWDGGMGGVEIYNNIVWEGYPGIFINGHYKSDEPTNNVHVHDNTVAGSPDHCDLMLTAIGSASDVSAEHNRVSSDVWLNNAAHDEISVNSNSPDQTGARIRGAVGCDMQACAKPAPVIKAAAKPMVAICMKKTGVN